MTAPYSSSRRSTAAAPASWCASRLTSARPPPSKGGPPAADSCGRPRPSRSLAMSEATSQQLVVFSLGSEEYALPIGTVHEIIRFTEPRSVASDADWIRGVIGLRGKIIPIFDLASRMELGAAGSEPGKIVIVES